MPLKTIELKDKQLVSLHFIPLALPWASWDCPYTIKITNTNLVFDYVTAYNLDFYTEVMDLNYLVDQLKDDPFTKKYKKLNDALVGLVEDYSLVSFVTLNIQVKIRVYSLFVLILFICLFISSLICSLICSLIHSFVQMFIIHPFLVY